MRPPHDGSPPAPQQPQPDIAGLNREFGKVATHAASFAQSIMRIASILDPLVHKVAIEPHEATAQHKGAAGAATASTMGETLRLLQSSARNIQEIFAADLAKKLHEGCTKPINELGSHRGAISGLVASNAEAGEQPKKVDKHQIEACKVTQTFVQSVQEFIYAMAGSIDNTNTGRAGGFWERMQSAVPVHTPPSSSPSSRQQQSPAKDKGQAYRTLRVESPRPRQAHDTAVPSPTPNNAAVLIRVREKEKKSPSSEQQSQQQQSAVGSGPGSGDALAPRPTLVNALRQRPKADRRGIRLEASENGTPPWAEYGPADGSASPTVVGSPKQEQLRSPTSDAITQTLSVKEPKKPTTRGAGTQTEEALMNVRSAQTDDVPQSQQPNKKGGNLVTPAPSVIGMHSQPSMLMGGLEVECQTGNSLGGVNSVGDGGAFAVQKASSTSSSPKNSPTPSASDVFGRPNVGSVADTRPNPSRGSNRQNDNVIAFESVKFARSEEQTAPPAQPTNTSTSSPSAPNGKRSGTPPAPPPLPPGPPPKTGGRAGVSPSRGSNRQNANGIEYLSVKFPFQTAPTPIHTFKTGPQPTSPRPGNDDLLAAIREARDKKPSDFARSRSPSPQPRELPKKPLTPHEELMEKLKGKFGNVRRGEDEE